MSIKQGCALTVLTIPGSIITWKGKRLSQVSLHSSVHSKAYHMIQGAMRDCTDDVRRSNDVPLDTSFLAVVKERIFLRVVEIVFQVDSWITLERGIRCWTNVKAVMLRSCLEEKPLWLQISVTQSAQEILQQGSY